MHPRTPRGARLARLLAPCALWPLAIAGCGGDDGPAFEDFCFEVAMVDCGRAARPLDACDVDDLEAECAALGRAGAWDAVACSPPTYTEADNCLNRLAQFGGETPLESVPPCRALCPDGFF